jgi:hypothetical protein
VGQTCGAQIAAPSALLFIDGVALHYVERIYIKCGDVFTECLRWILTRCAGGLHADVPVFHCALREV